MENQDKNNVQRPFKGMVTDFSPIDQPADSYRFALNALHTTAKGDLKFLSNELSNKKIQSLNPDFQIIGYISGSDDTIYVFSRRIGANPQKLYTDEIGVLFEESYIPLVQTSVLNFQNVPDTSVTSLPALVTGVFRIIRNNQRIIYWVDGVNKPRFFNIDRQSDFYSEAYQDWINAGSIGTFTGEKWSETKFLLFKSYSQTPHFISATIDEGGQVLSGSYSIAVQLIDDNLGATEWITTSKPVLIYHDSVKKDYNILRGSRNINTAYQSFANTTKQIKWTLGNFDPEFPYYRIAVLCANTGDGHVNKVLVSDIISTSDVTFTFSGNENNYTLSTLEDIQAGKMDVESVNHIEQIDNRLILGGIKGKQVDWCSLQQFASQIKPNFVVRYETYKDINNLSDTKNPTHTFETVGYMPEEVYSFGIVYIYKDGTKSPAYHIPGAPSGNNTTGMGFYQGNTNYPDIHKCSSYQYGFWGKDFAGNTLVGTPIRHHKFPSRDQLLAPTVMKNMPVLIGQSKNLKLTISYSSQFIVGKYYGFKIAVTTTNLEGNTHTAYSNYVWKCHPYGREIYIPCVTGTTIPATSTIDSVIITPTMAAGDDACGNWGIPPQAWPTGGVITIDSIDETIAAVYTPELKRAKPVFGIKFTNIILPSSDIVGYEIVRNKREDADKCVIDNVLVGPLTVGSKQGGVNPSSYHAFGLLNPYRQQSTYSQANSVRGFYIFSPEHQYLNKKLYFSRIKFIGRYTKSTAIYDTGDPNSSVTARGRYLQDVQAGTTYDPTVDKTVDNDGFDLFIRNRVVRYDYSHYSLAQRFEINGYDNIHYLSAGSTISSDVIYYNASMDNKIMIATFPAADPLPPTFFSSGNTGYSDLYNALLIKDNLDCYSNFINRAYYSEQNNPSFNLDPKTLTYESDEIFNGDAYLGSQAIRSSVYLKTEFGAHGGKKSAVWKEIVGSLLIIVGAVVGIVGTFVGATSLGIMIASAGVSMLCSGIEFEQMKKMMEIDYEHGLQESIRDAYNDDDQYLSNGGDDYFQWYNDGIAEMDFESSININLRAGLTFGSSDFLYPFEYNPLEGLSAELARYQNYVDVYLANKFTVLDREQQGGRLYLGFPVTEFYDINLDYLRKNCEKKFFSLPIEYPCCGRTIETFTNRVMYSETAFQEEVADNYRNFLPNNYKDLPGEYGTLTNVFSWQNNLYLHTDLGLYKLPRNYQERVNQEFVSFIGTGEFFSIPPILESQAGSDYKLSTVKSPYGVLFLSQKQRTIFLLTDAVRPLDSGMQIWLYNNIPATNPSSLTTYYFTAGYDPRFKRFLITKYNYYHDDIPDWRANYSWTLSYSLENQTWTSFHSYLPKRYLNGMNTFYSFVYHPYSSAELYKHNIEGKFGCFYGDYSPFIVEVIAVANPLVNFTWEDILIHASAKEYNAAYKQYVDSPFKFFNYCILYNDTQSSGLQSIIPKPELADSPVGLSPNYMLYQITDSNEGIMADKREGIWSLNDLRNMVVNPQNLPLFVNDWASVKDEYFIDKVVNPAIIDTSKAWMDIDNLRSKYLAIRLIYRNFVQADNVQLTTNYLVETTNPSVR